MSCCPPGSAPYLAADHKDEGGVAEAGGVKYYQVGSGEVGLLILPDVFGWNGGRCRALADEFAKKGLAVFVPKALPAHDGGTDDDGLPPNFSIKERGSELGPLFKGAWGAKEAVPRHTKVVEAMRTSGVKKFGVIGICLGTWHAMHLSQAVPGEELVCAAGPHPSAHIEGMLGGDPCELGNTCGCPWAFFPCGEPGEGGGDPAIYDKDGALYMNLEARFPGKNMTKRYAKMIHGFITRGAYKEGDFSNAGAGDEVKVAVQECVEDIARFFETHGLIGASA